LTVLRLSLDVVISNGNGRQAEASALEIGVERYGDTGSMSLAGELDQSQTERFAEQLRGLTQESAVRNLTLDLQDLRSIDPAGLGVIRAVWEAADQSGVEAILVRASSDLRFALEESGLDRVLPVIYECPDRPSGL
jgi:anti-anti-sigma factor